MRRSLQIILSIYSLLVALVAAVILLSLNASGWISGLTSLLLDIADRAISRRLVSVFLLALILVAAVTLTYALLSGRLRKTRVMESELGMIDVGVEALENIALNSAQVAQGGIKTAKARVFQGKENSLRVEISCELYADIQIPMQMERIQERVKKDLERYTGIPVSDVKIRVKRVELLGARVER